MRGKAKASLAIVLSACLVLVALAPSPAWGAAAETRYELIAGGLTFGNDIILTGQGETMFHQQALAITDRENLGVSFPGALAFSPSQGVDLALPSISQTVDRTISSSSTGFFAADLPFYPCCNYGAAPVGIDHFGEPSPVTPASFRSKALMYPEMVNQGILDANLTYDTGNANSTMVSLPPALATGAYGEVAAIANTTIGEKPRNSSIGLGPNVVNRSWMTNSVSTKKIPEKNITPVKVTGNVTTPILLSELRFDFDSSAPEINNTGIVVRMWRNSHLGHLANVAYEGDASRPLWTEPMKPYDALQHTNHTRVLNYARNMTRTGSDIVKAFWDL